MNRQYLQPEAAEVRAHIAWLERQPSFDICICLHEDWESQGFYLYELNPDNQPSFAQTIIKRVSEVCPIDMSPLIEGREAANGIIRPNLDPKSRPQWPEALYLLTYKTRLSYTLEAPSDFELATRVAAEVAALRVVSSELLINIFWRAMTICKLGRICKSSIGAVLSVLITLHHQYHVLAGIQVQLNYGAYASIPAHEQTKLRSPNTLSMRPTKGQNLCSCSHLAG